MNSISLEQELASILNSQYSENFLKEQLYDYKSIFLNRVFPDKSNPRFFPAIIMSDKHAYQVVTKQLTKQQIINIYNAEGHVVIGKSCIINCCKHGSNEWKKANKSIESIIELGENVAVSEIIQVPTIYPTVDGDYQILTGHRRFFAIIYANGIDGAAHFKVYKSKPVLQKTKQFQENASREDLPQYGKLRAFQDAMLEIEVLNTARKRVGQKPLTVKEKASTLGISMGAFDNYNVLTRYPAVIEAYENGESTSFVKMKKLIVECEKKSINGEDIKNVKTRKRLNSKLKELISQGVESVSLAKNKANSVKARAASFEIKDLQSLEAVRVLLTSDISNFEVGVDWKNINWEDEQEVKEVIKKAVAYANKLEYKRSHA